MESSSFNSRVSAAAFAVGLGLVVATSPGTAAADESDSPSSSHETESSTSQNSGSTPESTSPAKESGADTDSGAIDASPDVEDAPPDAGDAASVSDEDAVESDPKTTVDEPASEVEPAEPESGSSGSDSPFDSEDPPAAGTGAARTGEGADDSDASAGLQSDEKGRVREDEEPAGAHSDLAQLEDSAADPLAQEAAPIGSASAATSTQKIPTALAAQSAAVDTKPVGFLSGLLAALGISPSLTGSDGPLAPATFITAVLDVIRREMNRLFKNQAPIGPAVQVAHSGDGDVSGSIGAVDPEGDPLKYTVIQAPSSGSVVVDAAGNFTYTPGAELAVTGGADEFVVRVRDAGFRLNVLSPRTVEVPVTVTIGAGVPSGLLAAKSVAPLAAAAAASGGANSGNPGDELWGEAHFAPYVDMAGWPPPDLMKIAKDYGVSLLTLGFLQATSDGKAAWGGYSTLTPGSSDEQAQKIDASIAAFKAAGGDVMISFGGANGTELAQWHTQRGLSAQALANAYADVVDTYGLNRVDFDIEGHAVADPASIALRSQAIALLQQQRPDLEVWYTLPVLPSGLTHDGINVVDKALQAGVKLDGVNVMAMDYGESAAPTSGPNAKTMGAYAILAAESTYAQMSTLFAQHGEQFGWNQLGVTPMIGVNDVITEIFTVADAQAFEDFARAKGLGMVSMWSVGRDKPGSLGQASPTASGLDIPAGSFSNVWNDYGTLNEMDLGGTTGGGGPVTGGTTTVIGWMWGTDTVLNFDPAKDKLDFGWFQPGNFEVTEAAGSTRIAIVDNNQTYTLNGVGLNELSMGNIVALDSNTTAKWQTLISSASTPVLPTISIANVSKAEGNGGSSNLAFTVTLSKAATTPVTVKYATSNGTATAGSDYTAASGTVTFAPGVTSQTVNVVVLGDTAVESDETFTVTLSTPTGATISKATATGTITNDDAAPVTLPSVSIADLSVSEGNGSHGHFMFSVTLDKASPETVTVNYATSNGTATAGSDYVAASGTLTFAPGVTSQMVHVDIIGNAVVEPNETFTVTLSDPTGATLADATAVGTITNDDVADPGPDPDPDPDPDPQPGDGTIYLVSTSGPDIT
ncbi:MAG: Calx-beta domain-containing protein, partial [Mycolicibacterium sp.]|uniref:Calx-beta domain-containing protein n=1 Tax=Mycolicibacterium sp. TaxID=2320850 RepID=UPI003D1301FD